MEMSRTAAFFTLLGAIYDHIPENYAGLILAEKPGVSVTSLQNTKAGKNKDLNLLALIAKVSVQDWQAPAYLQPFI